MTTLDRATLEWLSALSLCDEIFAGLITVLVLALHPPEFADPIYSEK